MPRIISPLQFKGLKPSKTSRIIPVDATWYLPTQNKLGFDQFKKQRIPGAIFMDIDTIKDNTLKLPHMLPTPSQFLEHVSALGLRPQDRLVFYDQVGNFSAPRAAWMFDVFNHKDVYLLDNYLAYVAAGLPVDKNPVTTNTTLTASDYSAPKLKENSVILFEEFFDIVTNKRDQYTILDARSEGRFQGTAPEPRPGLPSGHAPGTQNVAAPTVLDENKQFLSPQRLRLIFQEKGVGQKPIIVTCGTGVTACILKTALQIAGFEDVRVFDGSWTEYASKVDPKYIESN